MLVYLVVFCEVAFWALLAGGLSFLYIFKKPKVGGVLLALSPGVDAVLLVATAFDLRAGSPAVFAHVLSVIYLAMALVYGRRMVRWMDVRFNHRFCGGPAPEKKAKGGRAHAAQERAGWLRHLAMFSIACIGASSLALFSGHPQEVAEAYLPTFRLWGIIVAIDFVVSFSYTLFPRKEDNARG